MPKVAGYLSRMELGPEWMGWGLGGLFAASFLAATVLPFSSEAVLVAMVAGGGALLPLFLVSTVGNTMGGAASYAIGRWVPAGPLLSRLGIDLQRADRWGALVRRRGAWAGLFCWLPVVGDALALALGLFRAPFGPSILFMLVGKAARYAVLLWMVKGMAGG